MKNQLNEFLRTMDKAEYFKINLLICAKDDNDSVLAEKWQFIVKQKPSDELINGLKSDEK